MPPRSSSAKFSYLGNCTELLNKVEKFLVATDNDEPGGCVFCQAVQAQRVGAPAYPLYYLVTLPSLCPGALMLGCKPQSPMQHGAAATCHAVMVQK